MMNFEDFEKFYAVSIEARPRLLDEAEPFALSETFERLVCWIKQHKAALLRHWSGKTSSGGLFREITARADK